MIPNRSLLLLLASALLAASCSPRPAPPPARPSTLQAAPPTAGWRTLFDGKTMTGWKLAEFPESQVKPYLKDGQLVMPTGTDMTGVVWSGGELPKVDYELEVAARRVEGNDFFCALTFPHRDSHASLVVGGWGGELCGISCIDGDDASRNETAANRTFEKGKWYTIRLRVHADRIQAWIDDQSLVDVKVKGRHTSVRLECEPCRPLGLATWQTTGAVRSIQMRSVAPEAEQ